MAAKTLLKKWIRVLCSFNFHRYYSNSLTLSNVGEHSWEREGNIFKWSFFAALAVVPWCFYFSFTHFQGQILLFKDLGAIQTLNVLISRILYVELSKWKARRLNQFMSIRNVRFNLGPRLSRSKPFDRSEHFSPFECSSAKREWSILS